MVMESQDKKQIKEWLKTWQKAGAELEKIKQQELENYDYHKNKDVIDSMLEWAYEHRTIQLTSGLVEQQRLFAKMREQS